MVINSRRIMNPRTKDDSIYQEVHVPGNPWVARCISTGTRRVMTRTRSKSRSRVTSLTLGSFSLHLTASVVVAPPRIFPGRLRTHTTFKRSELRLKKKKKKGPVPVWSLNHFNFFPYFPNYPFYYFFNILKYLLVEKLLRNYRTSHWQILLEE